MDTAIIRGRVLKNPEFIRNSGSERCVFTIALELPWKLIPDEGKNDVEIVTYATVTAATEPELTPRCEAFLRKDDEVVVMGQFGLLKDRLKMRVTDIDLPEVIPSDLAAS